jgi:uncharacterized protein
MKPAFVGAMFSAVLLATTLHSVAQTAETFFDEQEVVVETATPGVRLAGTLTVPRNKGPHPAAILITGNGSHTRDQLISGSPMFRMIAEYLTLHGIAVLRVDDRGAGRSTGPSVDDSTTAELAADTLACFQFLKRRPEIKSDSIGLIGHSEGAMIGPMVAVKEPGVRYLVLLAPPAVPGSEIKIRQMTGNLAGRGAKPEVVRAVEEQLRRLLTFLVSGKNDDETFYQLGHDFVAAHGMAEEKITRHLIDNLVSDFRRKWERFFFGYDPAQALKNLRTPMLAVMGAADTQVSVEQNLRPLVGALVEANNPDFTVSVMPDQDHFFLEFEGRRLAKHNFGKMKVSPRLLETITQWIHRR